MHIIIYPNFNFYADLIDTILQLQSSRLSLIDVKLSLLQLREYLRRFRPRLSPSNSLAIERLVVFLTGILRYMQDWAAESIADQSQGGVFSVNELMSRLDAKVAGLNLPTLLEFLRSSKVQCIVILWTPCCANSKERSQEKLVDIVHLLPSRINQVLSSPFPQNILRRMCQ